VKTTTNIDDPQKRVRDLSFHTPLALGAQPWTWDFGTGSWSYGVLRSPGESVRLSQSVGPAQATKWEIRSGQKGSEQHYEQNGVHWPSVAEGWGHIQDQSEAVAFAIADFGTEAGSYSTTLDGDGQLTFRWAPSTSHSTATISRRLDRGRSSGRRRFPSTSTAKWSSSSMTCCTPGARCAPHSTSWPTSAGQGE